MYTYLYFLPSQSPHPPNRDLLTPQLYLSEYHRHGKFEQLIDFQEGYLHYLRINDMEFLHRVFYKSVQLLDPFSLDI